jgi:hypothetical protein
MSIPKPSPDQNGEFLSGRHIYRVHWVLGTDLLLGVCHCGAGLQAEDPVELWEWLLRHPDGHDVSVPLPTGPLQELTADDLARL